MSSVTDLSAVTGYRAWLPLESKAAGGDVRFLRVLVLDGAAASVTAAHDSTVMLNLGNGKAATIAFNRNNTTTTLGAGVDALAWY